MHVSRDARNLKRSSQVLSSLFRVNLRELTLILSKNSDSKKSSPIYPNEAETKTLFIIKLGGCQ